MIVKMKSITLYIYNLSSPQKRTAIIEIVITETTHYTIHITTLNAPASVLTLNESSVDGFISNFFSML